MNVLVLAYYFPPLGLSGVQRTTKFVKYLHEYGWYPIVLSPSPAGYFARDPSLLEDLVPDSFELIRSRSWDPTRLVRSGNVSYPTEPRRRRLSRLSQLLFVPDNKIGWYPLAVRAAKRVARSTQIDAVFSTAPPYTSHLIGRKLSEVLDVPLVLDYRDDWLNNPRHDYPSQFHERAHARQEARVVHAASGIIAINSAIADAIRRRYPEIKDRVSVIPQGYDPDDFQHPPSDGQHEVCEFLYTGVFYDAQTPDTFLRAVAGWRNEHPDDAARIRVSFAGLLPTAAVELVAELGLAEVVETLGYLPHRETCERMMRADILWMTIGDVPGAHQISTGKLYEYFGTRKPILGLVPSGVAADDLRRYSAGIVVHPDDVDTTKREIERLFRQWQAGRLPQADPSEVDRFDRKRLTGELAASLDSAVGTRSESRRAGR